MPLRFLHVSDIHLLDLRGVPLWRYLNKRLTGGMNLALRRRKSHNGDLFDSMVGLLKDLKVDRVVVTGDLTNLALESEFAHVAHKLDELPTPATVIPGNHDTYTRGSVRTGRFERYLHRFMEGERVDDEPYPFVQRFGSDVALIGVSSAIATGPFNATGAVGAGQLERLSELLAKTRAERRRRIVLIHHPVMPGVAALRHNLLDLEDFGRVIAAQGAELILHGHEHRQIEGTIPGPEQPVPVHGIASGTYLSDHPSHRAAFSIYDVSHRGIERDLYAWNGTRFELHIDS